MNDVFLAVYKLVAGSELAFLSFEFRPRFQPVFEPPSLDLLGQDEAFSKL